MLKNPVCQAINAIKAENLFLKENNNSYKTGYAILHNRLGIDRNIVSNFIHREYEEEQLSIKEFVDPFTSQPVKEGK